MPQFSIGTFQFINIDVFPVGQKQQVSMESRPGVDGLYFWLTGQRGTPFTVTTAADVADANAAALQFIEYEQAIGSVVSVVWNGNALPKRYVIVDVQPVTEGIRQTILGVGGLLGTSQGLVTAQWTLAAAPIDLEVTP